MGDRGNIVIKQSGNDQIWIYGHWAGYQMPARLQLGLREGKGRWKDDSYLARIIFCRTLPQDQLYSETGYGLSCRITDNEHPIMVADIELQKVYVVKDAELKDGQIPKGYKPKKSWSFQKYCELTKLPWGEPITPELVGKVAA